MLLQTSTKGPGDKFLPKEVVIHKRERAGHAYQKRDNLQSGLKTEATVLGTIQILCGLMISSLGVILVLASHSSYVHLETSTTTLKSGYPFGGALCFVIAGSLSIISGKTSTKPFVMSSLTSNVISSAAAGAGLFLLTYSLVGLGTTTQSCTSLSYLEHYESVVEDRDYLLANFSIAGVLLVMLVCTGLELLMAVYASAFWWKRVYSNERGEFFKVMDMKKKKSSAHGKT